MEHKLDLTGRIGAPIGSIVSRISAEGCDLDSGAEDKARTMGSRLRIDGPSFPTAFLSTPLGLW
jgi:hypothetical protein